jgi:gliding motility-associated-like protein
MRTLHTLPSVVLMLLLVCLGNYSAQAQSGPKTPQGSIQQRGNDFCVGEELLVDNLTITNGHDCYYYWNWGDGTTETDSTFVAVKKHVYQFPSSQACTNPDGGIGKRIELLIVPKAASCKHLTSNPTIDVRIFFPPLPDFTTPASICMDDPTVKPFNISCPTQDDSTTTLLWEVIDLSRNIIVLTSTEKFPTFVFPYAGNFKIVLKVTNHCGTATKDQFITVIAKPDPQADVTLNGGTQTVCAPYKIVVNNTSTGSTGNKWQISPATGWRFINGTSDTTALANIEFTDNGDYDLSLVINSLCGDRKWNMNQKIIVKSKPKVAMDTLVGSCVPFAFTPVATVTNDGGLPVTYEWTIQGGSKSTATTLDPGAINFPAIGKFPIKFKATNTCGSDEVTRILEARDKINIAFTDVPNKLCNSGSAYALKALPTGGVWSGTGVLPDGTFDPSAVGVGTYKLKYTVTFGACSDNKDTTIRVYGTVVGAGTQQVACGNDLRLISLQGGTPVGGVWSGTGVVNGSTGAFDPSVSGIGTFNVTYTYKDPFSGCANTAVKPVEIHAIPKALIDPLPPFCLGDAKVFKHLSQGTTLVQWNFGDGDSTNTAEPTHGYAKAGNFIVRLIATDANNCSDTTSSPVNVYAPPTAAFSQSANEGYTPLSVSFTNNSVGVNVSYEWDFGGGRIVRVKDPGTLVFDNTINRDSVYKIRLSASTPGCPVAIDTSKVTVFTSAKANFAIDLGAGCSPLTVNFANTSTGDPRSYFWDFGNGKTSTEINPPAQLYYTDTTFKPYTVRLIATNTCGIDTLERSVTVKPANVRSFFGVNKLEGCVPLTITMTSGATVGAKMSFDLGNGILSNNQEFTHTFDKAGSYTIRQTVTAGCGVAFTEKTINVWATPAAKFDYSQFNICKDRRVKFTQKAVDSVSVYWDFGDGTQSATHNPIHDYGRSGNFKVVYLVEDFMHGCQNQDSTIIAVRSPLKFDIDSVKHSGCYGINTGAIVIRRGDVTGGLPTYEFAMNDSTFKDPNKSGIFSNLKGRDNYIVYVRDRAGCVDSASAYVKGFPPLDLDAGRDREIDLGDSTQTFVTTNAYKLLDLRWTPKETVSCDTCENVWLSPVESTTYTVTAKGPEGCEEKSDVVIRVVGKRKIYVPNVFTPNDDGENDMFFPNSGKNVKRITYFRVFNRWGELVFENKDFQPNEQFSGWNGKYNGMTLPSDVYVWTMEVELRNGIMEKYNGDVTIMK